MKVIIAGSRHLTDYTLVRDAMWHAECAWGGNRITTIISGRAKGIDTLGEQWAREGRYEIEYFPADWRRHGASAGPIRNAQMADIADRAVIIIPNYIASSGSRDMARQMLKRNKPILVADVGLGAEGVKYYEHGGRETHGSTAANASTIIRFSESAV